MRGPGVFGFLCLAFASSAVVLAACSLAVDTAGLSGGETSASETGTTDGDAATDGGAADVLVTDGSVPDAGFSCDGITKITTFDLFTPESDVVLQGGSLTATASTNGKGKQFSAVGRWDVPTIPSRTLLSYDLTLTRSDVVYFEPGCVAYFEDGAGQTLLRHTFGANHAGFAAYLNLTAADGGADDRVNDLPDLPSGETTRHIELLLTSAGANASVDLAVDGVLHSEPAVLTEPPFKLVLRCGIAYGEQTQPGSATTIVTIKNLSISLCP